MKKLLIVTVLLSATTIGCQESSESGSSSANGMSGPQGPAGPQGPQGPQGVQGLQGIQGPAGAFSGLRAPVHLPNPTDLGSTLAVDQVWINNTGKFIFISGSIQLETTQVPYVTSLNFVQANLMTRWDSDATEIAYQHYYLSARADDWNSSNNRWDQGYTRVMQAQRFPVFFTLAPGGRFRISKMGGTGNLLIGPEWFYQEMN